MSHSRTTLLLFSTLLAAAPLFAQGGPPAPGTLSADVVVTADALPETAGSLGVAATVIDRAEIERSKASSALELLRAVPGLDLVESGGPGAATSAFLRGTNSNETLYLLDGVKLNGPFFGNFDLSSLDTTNVERIEVVRGPFSALYGSDAIGGVVQIFTRRGAGAAPGFSGRGTLLAGNARTREGTLGARFSEGIVQATAGFRRSTTDGELPNEYFAVTNVSGSVEVAPSSSLRAGLVVRRDDGKTGIPFSGGVATPNRSTAQGTTTVTLPLTIFLGGETVLEAAPSLVRESLTFTDPDDPYGYTHDRSDSDRFGGRATVSRTFGAQRVSLGAELERTFVTDRDAFGLEVDDRTTRTWAVFVEDRISFLDDRLVATAGLRRDDHSAFGGSTNPRAALSFRVSDTLKLRAAAGSAFRSPTTGELYYPFGGNASLKPERATAYEVGAEVAIAPGARLETSVFWSSIRELIEYDFTTNANRNVGRARTRGVELALVGTLAPQVTGRVSYTYLDAIDRDTSEPLLRRPRHRASATLGWTGTPGSAQLTALFVGRRADVDAITFAHVEDPSYVRFDIALTGPRIAARFAPFLRLTNLFGRKYAEAAGFPAPGRRFAVGLEVIF